MEPIALSDLSFANLSGSIDMACSSGPADSERMSVAPLFHGITVVYKVPQVRKYVQSWVPNLQ